MFYFTFGVTVIAVRSVVQINDNDYDMMMNMKQMMKMIMMMMMKGWLWRFIENGELTQPGMIPGLGC